MHNGRTDRWVHKNHRLWEVLASNTIVALPNGIAVDVERVRLPDGRIVDDYYRLRSRDSAVIVARTVDNRVVLEWQYKHGVGGFGLTLPAGLIEDGEVPISVARRELLEETGYATDQILSLGRFVRNGNIFGGADHLFIADGVEYVQRPNSGDLEDIEIVLLTPTEAIAALRRGDVLISSHAAALAMALLGS